MIHECMSLTRQRHCKKAQCRGAIHALFMLEPSTTSGTRDPRCVPPPASLLQDRISSEFRMKFKTCRK
ncbi:hypothetical protein HJC23_013681 [Cyclotella cryptica]|uniref:Uncharacterized protein n=1 Tax=Cyclotella cryptica TaxID=29204 RepID=A0ABD3QUG0_9STRA